VVEPEGGGGDYGPNSGGYDSLGFGTLTAIEQASATLPVGVKRSFQSVNYPARWMVTEGDSLGYLDPVDTTSTSAVKQSASFTVVSGLADSRGYSLQAPDGRYLRHAAFRLQLGSNDGTDLFHKDATFYVVPGSASGSVRFISYNYRAGVSGTATTNSGSTRTTSPARPSPRTARSAHSIRGPERVRGR